jgi:hypothetical protein
MRTEAVSPHGFIVPASDKGDLTLGQAPCGRLGLAADQTRKSLFEKTFWLSRAHGVHSPQALHWWRTTCSDGHHSGQLRAAKVSSSVPEAAPERMRVAEPPLTAPPIADIGPSC